MANSGKTELIKGILLIISFFGVLILMFSPVFNGLNAFEVSDKLFNSIAKGSSYYIQDILKESEEYKGKIFEAKIKLKDDKMIPDAEKVFTLSGGQFSNDNGNLKISGDIAQIVQAAIKDSDSMFYNKGKEICDSYGYPEKSEKQIMVTWWTCFKEIMKDLKKQEKFKDAEFIDNVMKKTIEVAYNFYEITPEKAIDKAGVLSIALIFYIFYTLWWGYAILFVFEGLGLRMKAGRKKEM